VTTQLVSLGDAAAGVDGIHVCDGDVEAPISQHRREDVGCRLSRVEADTPLNAQSVTSGWDARF
jgi:hypothetical protein